MPQTQPSGAYNFYDWKTYDDKENQNLMNVYRNAGRLGNQLVDFSSPIYTGYQAWANKAIPGVGAGSFLSLLQSGGGNYAGSMAQAMQLKSNADKQRRDAINTGVQGFASQNVGMLPQLLQIQSGAGGDILNARTQKEVAGMQSGGILDIGGSFLGGVGGMMTANGFAGLGPLAFLASDIKVKENIDYTGEYTKDGIPIVNFNYIGNSKRFRGVIAQDVEKVRPDAVIEINGIKHVYYGRL